VVTRSLIAPTVIVDMPAEVESRARWAHAKRHPMFAAWLPSPELATIHSERVVTTHHRPSPVQARMIAALACSAALGIVIFFAVRAARGTPERDTRSARRGHVVDISRAAPSPLPLVHPPPSLARTEAPPPVTDGHADAIRADPAAQARAADP